MPKRKFLVRGSGKAGGGGNSIAKSLTPHKSPRAVKEFNSVYNNMAAPIQTNSIDDFKNLEDRVKEQNKNF
jgi:hypothetical protein